MQRLWTAEDDAILTKLAAKGTKVSKIAKTLDRTENAIRLRCKKLDVRLMNRGRKWTQDEEALFIQEWYDEDISNNTLVKHHKRSWHALQEKACVLNLGGRPRNTSYLTVSDICKEMKVSSDRVYNWVKLGLKVHKAKDNRSRYLIDTDDLLIFLEHHQRLFDASIVSTFLFASEPAWFREKRHADSLIDMSKNNIEWSNADDKQLVYLYNSGRSISQLSQVFKRSEKAIISRLNVLCIERKNPHAYSDDEIQVLMSYSDQKTVTELAEMLPGRTESGILYKCKALGLPYHLKTAYCKCE